MIVNVTHYAWYHGKLGWIVESSHQLHDTDVWSDAQLFDTPQEAEAFAEIYQPDRADWQLHRIQLSIRDTGYAAQALDEASDTIEAVKLYRTMTGESLKEALEAIRAELTRRENG